MDGNFQFDMNPLVSVIIPVYNAGKYLSTAIESVIAQSWFNWELIIVDDGSTDNSLQIAQSCKNEKVAIVVQANQGASVARNTGLKLAKGDYIQFLDADDYLSADKIEAQIHALGGSTSHLGLCKTMHFYDGKESIKLSAREDWYCADTNDPVDFLIKLNAGNEIMPGFGGMIQPNAWLTPRALIDKAGLWNEFRCPDDDGEFFCRVLLVSEGIKYSSTGLNFYRRYRASNSLSGQKNLDTYESILQSINLKHSYLKAKSNNPLIDRIFARHYWWTGVSAYPRFKQISGYYIKKAVELGYNGKKYVGGPAGHKLASLIGWKGARQLFYYKQLLKKLIS